jgi:broad specificity phosphatase PhoE
MSSIFLVRHATPKSFGMSAGALAVPEDEDGLSDQGIQEANDLGRAFASMGITSRVVIVSSGMRRAQETAAVIAAAVGSTYASDDRLNELHLNLGPMATEAQSRDRQLLAFRSPTEHIDGAESVAEHRARVATWFADLYRQIDSDPDAARIIVSHGGTMDHILGCVFGSLSQTLETYFIACPCAHFHRLTRIEPRNGWKVWRVDAMNQRFGEPYPRSL